MQLKLFDPNPKPAGSPRVWRRLRQEDRVAVIARVTRLLVKSIKSQLRSRYDER